MISVGLCAPAALAGIYASGDVDPADPATWNALTSAAIGGSGVGSIIVDDDSDLASGLSIVGLDPGSSGTATVSGAGTTWGTFELRVGYDGIGMLEIADGGTVTNLWFAGIGYRSGSTGTVTVSGGASWTNSSHLYVGRSGDGTLEITDGGSVSNTYGFISSDFGAAGEVTVSGDGATWTNSGELHVGSEGTLNIADGGMVEVVGSTYVARYAGSAGAINFADNVTFTTGALLAAPASLNGTGTINTSGLVSDVDLVFDAAGGLSQALTIDGPGRNVTVNLNADGSGPIGAGYGGSGSMRVADGLVLQSTNGFVGYHSDSTGTVTVTGAGSAWANSDKLSVAHGTLSVTGGGAVSSTSGHVGSNSGAAGTATVSGAASSWANSGGLGVVGDGALSIFDGGLVSVGGGLTIDLDGSGNSFVNMGSGGVLALAGDADGTLGQFLGLIDGSDAIRYWDESTWGWADITGATPDDDYTLAYTAEGDLAGYTVLTVTAPTAAELVYTNGDYVVDNFD